MKSQLLALSLYFFGRLETRKGLDIFLRALRKLSDEDKESISGVTFLGKNVTMGKTDSFTYIMNQTKNLGLAVNVISDYDRTNANEYIKKKKCISHHSITCRKLTLYCL